MHNRLCNYIKNLLLPCLGFSVAAGFLSAILITAFKAAASGVIGLSNVIYGAVREKPVLIFALILGTAALGLAASFLLSFSRSCRGGGIPTSVAAIRGIVSFRWFASILILPFSALMTFFCGLPLGTEGPCVQMGTAIGDGVVKKLGAEKHKGWRRYIMTGGASAGFSIATASPITAIIFSMEELHKHFSPLLLTVSSISVITAQITVHILSLLGIGSLGLFEIKAFDAISPKTLFAPLLVGLICGIFSILFTRFYHAIDKSVHSLMKKLHRRIVFPVIFALAATVGFFLPEALGTGHHLVNGFLHTRTVWYMLLLIFIVRAVFMMVANTAGVTGGIFLPTLAFGAVIGSVCADVMIALGWISPELYPFMVALGITAFLGATSRIPITACVFAIEALGAVNNVLPVILATTVALLTVEASGLEDFTDTVIDAKVRSITKGKTPTVVETALVAKEGSFIIGKEPRDVLWPNSCAVVSFERAEGNRGKVGVAEGDVITVHYKTYDPESTAKEFETLVGEQ